jgi:hypothetical protein
MDQQAQGDYSNNLQGGLEKLKQTNQGPKIRSKNPF